MKTDSGSINVTEEAAKHLNSIFHKGHIIMIITSLGTSVSMMYRALDKGSPESEAIHKSIKDSIYVIMQMLAILPPKTRNELINLLDKMHGVQIEAESCDDETCGTCKTFEEAQVKHARSLH